MISVNTHLKESLKEFERAFAQTLENASKQALKATANDVIKVTLPNNLKNVNTSKPASKQKGVFKANVKRLKDRIKENIMGSGIEGEDGMATAVPSADGNPLKDTIKGKSYYGIFLVAKQNGKNRRIKVNKTKLKIANSAQALVQFIKQNSKIMRKKVAYRQRTSKEIIWITKPSVLKQAAEIISKKAGSLLSGWSSLAKKTESNLLTILNGQDVTNNGTAKISTKEGKVVFQAVNNESHAAINSYQQRMVNSNIPRTFKYHMENALKNINWNKIRKSSIK